MKNNEQNVHAKSKKVLYIITKANWGGAQRYVCDLATHMHGEYDVVVAHGKNEFSGSNVFVNTLQQTGIATIELGVLGRDVALFDDIKAFFAVVRLLRKEKPGILHLNSSKAGAIGALAARLCGVRRIVYTAHGLPFLEGRPKWQNTLIKFTTWLTFVLSHRVIVVSKYEKYLVENWWFVKNKITHIYNGINKPSFLSRKEARHELSRLTGRDISDDVHLIGSIAELTKNKGLIEFLPKLAKKIKQKDALYVHFGTGELAERLKEEVENLGIADSVFWLGLVPDASRYLKAIDLFTLPSKKEGLPYTLIEARFAEIEIEASDVGGIPEILKGTKEDFTLDISLQKTASIYAPI